MTQHRCGQPGESDRLQHGSADLEYLAAEVGPSPTGGQVVASFPLTAP
jgi:hypothetical protein